MQCTHLIGFNALRAKYRRKSQKKTENCRTIVVPIDLSRYLKAGHPTRVTLHYSFILSARYSLYPLTLLCIPKMD